MPATNYNWPFNDQPPVYEVFGTKRKNCTDESSQDVVEELETKRRCTAARHCETEAMMDDTDSQTQPSQMSHPPYTQTAPDYAGQLSLESHMHHQTAMHSTTGIQDLAQHHLQVLMNNRLPPLPNAAGDNIENNNNNNNITHVVSGHDLNSNLCTQTDMQNKMIMDLNEGVYSTDVLPLNPQTDAEYEAACSMMATMDGEGAPDPHQYTLPYSDSNSGDSVSNSNARKVRCLCRPTWDGGMEVQPYVSDYY